MIWTFYFLSSAHFHARARAFVPPIFGSPSDFWTRTWGPPQAPFPSPGAAAYLGRNWAVLSLLIGCFWFPLAGFRARTWGPPQARPRGPGAARVRPRTWGQFGVQLGRFIVVNSLLLALSGPVASAYLGPAPPTLGHRYGPGTAACLGPFWGLIRPFYRR